MITGSNPFNVNIRRKGVERFGSLRTIERDLERRNPRNGSVTLSNTTGGSGWKQRIKGLVYLGIGSVFGVFAIGLIWAVNGMDDYYYVPHACECLECAHGTKTAPDGRVHCAKYPPKDIKVSEVSAGYVKFCQCPYKR